MGSLCYTMELPRPLIERAIWMDWREMGRRVFVDGPRGFISFMSPSRVHERYAEAVGDVARAAGRQLGLRLSSQGSSRFRHPNTNRMVETGCLFSIFGSKAETWLELWTEDRETATQWARKTPEDLVVEVERTHGDEEKPDLYRAVGVTEMWRVDVPASGPAVVVILDLQAAGGVREADQSLVLPGATRDLVANAVELAAGGGLVELEALIRETLVPLGDGKSGRGG